MESEATIQRTDTMRSPAGAPEHRPNTTRTTLAGTINGVLAGVLLLWGCGTTSVTKVEVRERRDSIVIHYDTIHVVTMSDSIRTDTVRVAGELRFRSVKAYLDTTVSGTTMKLRYQFPPDTWSVQITKKDTAIRWVVHDSIVQRPYEVQVVPFWVYLALGGMGLALLIAGVNAVRK